MMEETPYIIMTWVLLKVIRIGIKTEGIYFWIRSPDRALTFIYYCQVVKVAQIY